MVDMAKEALPRHIGIIMDGNGRWAKQRGLPRSQGHRQGAKVFREITAHCRKIGIEYLTVYAFSTENWKRPQEEVDAIMDLLRDYLKEVRRHADEQGRIRFIGDPAPLAPDLREQMQEVMQRTQDRAGMTVNIALNYGGRDELTQAMRRMGEQIALGALQPGDIDEATVEQYLYTAGQPDVDCVIRPSGEQRLSNFLLWQAAYAEFVYLDVLWPDFTPKHLDEALEIYRQRNRRFGGV